MLVLSRKVGEAIKLSDDIEITVLAVDNLRVRLGIRAPAPYRRPPHRNAGRRTWARKIARRPSWPTPRSSNGILTKAASEKKKQE